MTVLRAVLIVFALAVGLASCTAGPVAPTAPGGSAPVGPPAAPPLSTTGESAEVEATFLSYNEALKARDYAAACAVNAPATTAALIEALQAQGVTAATCEEAFSTVYAIPGAGEAADRIADGTRIQGVTVDGDTATVSWSADTQGQRRTVESGFQRIDGQWRLLSANP